MGFYEQIKYSHVCDNCEQVRYPLNYVTYRTDPVMGRIKETGEIVTVFPAKWVTARVCDECIPAYEDQDD